MSRKYNQHTRRILEDFPSVLGQNDEVDATLLGEIRAMVRKGQLGYPSQIRQVVKRLRGRADELQG